MQFRRSDFDVTNRINTTDPVCVKLEVIRIFRTLYARNQAPILNSAFDDVVRLYRGFFPGYTRCDTGYHDLQHILDVTLAMARLLDGYERSRADGPPIGERLFQLGVICALFHDMGYIRGARPRCSRRAPGAAAREIAAGLTPTRKQLGPPPPATGRR